MIYKIMVIVLIIIILYCCISNFDQENYETLNINNENMINIFNEYLHKSKYDWNYILPIDLLNTDKKNVFILDIRKSEDYKKGHIKDSTNIFWLDLLKPENLKKLPKNKEIIIVCYVGHTGSQILVLLKLLGYNAKVLKFGMGQSPTVGVPVAGWINYGFDIETT